MIRFLKRASILTLWAIGLLLALAIGISLWFYHSVTERMVAPTALEPVADLLTYRELPPRSSTPPALHWDVDLNDPASLQHPDPEVRPWARWWWPGGDVDVETACAQLRDINAQGFGGVEIQAFRAGLHVVDDTATQTRINSFDTPAYYATLAGVLDCARNLHMKVYLNHLSGWPAGGPQVPPAQGLQELRYSQFAIAGGGRVALPVPAPVAGLNDYVMALGEFFFGNDLKNFMPEHRRLVALVAGRRAGGERATNPLIATDTVALQAGSLVDLTGHVHEGKLEWDAPAGDWVAVALFVMPSGEAPTLIAADRSGFVIDHMNAQVLQSHYDYAFGSRTGLQPYYGAPLQGIFNDSLEFKVDRLAAVDIIEAFRERRGYDLTLHLPAVLSDARDNYFLREVGGMRTAPSFFLDDQDWRIAHDYQLTLSDLIIERFVDASANWASTHGMLSRGQSYGSDIDVIKALGHNNIPETEQLYAGGSELFLKLAGSAAYLYDRPLVSAEAFVWHNLAYAVEPARLKAAADKLFLGGVNQIIYHGIPYAVQGDAYNALFGPLGWYPFLGPDNNSAFSGNYGAHGGLWSALPDLNQYIAHCQNLLRAGRQELDVLIYYPFLGFPLEWERSVRARQEFLFAGALPGEPPIPQDPALSLPFSDFPDDDGDPRRLWLESLLPVIDALNREGITWGWINDDALTSAASGIAESTIAESTTVLVANAPWINAEIAQALVDRAAHGGKVALFGTLPQQQPGFLDFQTGDRRVRERMAVLAPAYRVDMEQLLAQTHSRVRLHGSDHIRRVSRHLPDGSNIHFFANQSRENAQARVQLPGDGDAQTAYWFDPRTGDSAPAVPDRDAYLSLALAPLESRFLITLAQTTPLQALSDANSNATEVSVVDRLLTHWTLQAEGLESLSLRFPLPSDIAQQLSQARGPLQYTTTVEVEKVGPESRYWLAIDRVDGALQVAVNDTDFGTLGVTPWHIDITDAVQTGDNRIQLTVTPPLRSRLLASFKADEPYAVALKPLQDASMPVGMLGPVTLQFRTTAPTAEQPRVEHLPQN